MSQPLQQISIIGPPHAETALVELLERQFDEEVAVCWDVSTGLVTISVYLTQPVSKPNSVRARMRAELAALVGQGFRDLKKARISIRRVPPQDWSESWKRHFKPIDVGGRLLVKPTWSRRQPKVGQALVVLDPGLSFGTGQHATTRFCLEQLVALRKPGAPQSLLDAGTGSGILAVAAARLGYSPVQAFDLDSHAVRTATDNCAINGVAESVAIRQVDLTRLSHRSRIQFDVVCANLTADILVAERSRLLGRVKSGGALVLAGILATQFREVEQAFAVVGILCARARTDREWRSGLFRLAKTLG